MHKLKQHHQQQQQRPLVRNVVIHCPEIACHHCPLEGHSDACVQGEDVVENDCEIKHPTEHKDRIVEHMRADDNVFIPNVCLCRATMGHIVDMVVEEGDDPDFVSVRFGIYAPELAGNTVQYTEDAMLMKLEMADMDLGGQLSDFECGGQKWAVYMTKQDSDALKAPFTMRVLAFDHQRGVHNGQHRTCPHCVGHQAARAAFAQREVFRRVNQATLDRLRTEINRDHMARRIDEATMAERMRQAHRDYSELPGDREFARELARANNGCKMEK